MTNEADILGRPPVMRPITQEEDVELFEDWRGEQIMQNIPRHVSGTGGFNTRAAKRKPVDMKRVARQQSKAAICAADGCARVLSQNNITKVCRGHRHTEKCRCLPCQNKAERGLK